MFALFRVDARFSELQARDWDTVDQMRFDNFGDIGSRDAAIPNRSGIHDERRAMFALIQAAGFVRANVAFQPARREFLLELQLQLPQARRVTAPAWIFGRPLIRTDEDVMVEIRHVRESVT